MAACDNGAASERRESVSYENKVLARRWLEEGFNEGNVAVADKIFAEDYVNHEALPGQRPGPEGTKHNVSMLRSAFPYLHIR